MDIRPISDLRNKFTEIEKTVKAGKPVYLTKNGYGTMVVLSIEEYAKLTDRVEHALDLADIQAESTAERLSHDEVLAAARKKSADKPYRAIYLPLFCDDLLSAAEYISGVLKNPQVANRLVNTVEEAILNRLPMDDRFEQYHSVRERKYPYYRIYAGNHVISYVVIETEIEKIMEVRRLLHGSQNGDKII